MRSRASLALALLLLPLRAVAQPCPAPSAADHAAAEALDREGRARFDAAEYGEAVRAWLAAHEREPRPALLYNVAVAQLRLPDPDAAFGSLTRELAGCGVTPEQRAAAEALRVEIRQRAVEVRFVPEAPEGAHPTLEIDRRPQDPSAWDRSHWLLPGEHEARARAEGMPDAVQTFLLTTGLAATVRLRLERPRTTGLLHVALAAPVLGATASIDARPWGELPQDADVEAGEHRVRVRAPGHAATDRRVAVPAGGRRDVEVLLLPDAVGGGPRPVYARGWFWGVVGSGAVVIAAAIVLPLLFAHPTVRDGGGTVCLESGNCP